MDSVIERSQSIQTTSELGGANTAPTTPPTETPQTQAPSLSFDDFMKNIPENYRAVFEKNQVKDFETLGKSYEGLLSIKGKKGLIPPSENATEEERTAFQKELHKYAGVPEDGKYDFELSENVNLDYVNDDFLNELATIAFKSGINQKGFGEIVNTIYEAYTAEKDELLSEIQSLRQKLGIEGKMELPTSPAEPTDYVEAGKKEMSLYYQLLREGKTAEAAEKKKLIDMYYQKAYSK